VEQQTGRTGAKASLETFMGRSVVRLLAVVAFLSGWIGAVPRASADFLFKKGWFEKSDVTSPLPSEQYINDVGFRPKAVIFFWTRQRLTDPNPSVDISGGWGFATGPSNAKAIATATVDGQTVVPNNRHTHRAQSESHCIIFLTSGVAGAVPAYASLVRFEPDGFRIQWEVNEARKDVIHYIAVGGSDITNAVADSIGVTTGTGRQPIAVGFRPDFVMFLGGRHGTAGVPTYTTEAHHTIGFATRTPLSMAARRRRRHERYLRLAADGLGRVVCQHRVERLSSHWRKRIRPFQHLVYGDGIRPQ
jgi:hypothetical protein